jgi:hypothetical protein
MRIPLQHLVYSADYSNLVKTSQLVHLRIGAIMISIRKPSDLPTQILAVLH